MKRIRDREALTGLEQGVLAILHESGQALSVREIAAMLRPDIGQKSLARTLDLMHSRGLLARGRIANVWMYATTSGQGAALAARRMHHALERAGAGRADALTYFVRELDPADRALLTAALARYARTGELVLDDRGQSGPNGSGRLDQ